MRLLISSGRGSLFWSFFVIGCLGLADLAVQTVPAFSQGYSRDRDGRDGGRRRGRCGHLARLAIEQNRSNVENRCGFDGPYWHSSRRRHVDACRGERTGRGERRRYNINRFEKREERLRRCMAGGGGRRDQACETFTTTALSWYQHSLKYRCKYSDSVWNDNSDLQYNWCRRASKTERAKRLDTMRYQYKRCKKRRGWRGIFKF